MDWARCPLVEINPRKVSGAPVVRGTRLPVQAIIDNHEDGLSAAEIAELFGADPRTVAQIIAFAKKQLDADEAHPAR